MTDPAHAARLVLLIALATYLALALGSRVIQAGLRRFLESTRQRMLSLFQIGMRWLMFCLTHDRAPAQEPVPGPVVEKCRSVRECRGGDPTIPRRRMEARCRPPRRRREVMSTPRTVRGEEPTSVVAGAVARRPAGSLHHPDPVKEAAMLVLSRKLQ